MSDPIEPRSARTPEDHFRQHGTIEELPPNVFRHPRTGADGSTNANEQAKSEPPLPLVWFDEIQPALEARDFVQGVLVEGGSVVAYGESNTGKTFFVTDLALHVAAGRPWQGRRVDQGGVIYCVLEGGNGFRNRVVAWRQAHDLNGTSIPFAAIPCALNLLDPNADTPRLVAAIKAAAERMPVPVKLVVIDTLSRAMAGGNENAPDDMGALVRSMDEIRQETGACVLFIHHSGKDAARGARGHSLLRAAIDTEIEIKADPETNSHSATIVKQRDLKKGDLFGFGLEIVTLGENQHGEPVTTCIVREDEPMQRTPGAKLTPTEQGWLRDIEDMFCEPGLAEKIIPMPGMSVSLTLTREQVRDGFRRKGRFSAPPDVALTGPDRERMRSMLNKLKDKGKIGLTDQYIWLPNPTSGSVSGASG